MMTRGERAVIDRLYGVLVEIGQLNPRNPMDVSAKAILMTDALTCTGPNCARPAPDAYLCTGCTRTLERILAELPATLTDLQTTITRQARTSRSGGGKPTKAADPPLPYDVHASDLADRVRNGLGTWVRHLCETRGVPVPRLSDHRTQYHPSERGPVCQTNFDPDTDQAWACVHDSCERIRRQKMRAISRQNVHAAVWLTAHVQSIRQDEAAGELLTQLRGIQSELRAAVDNREYRYAGTCRALLVLGDVRADDPGDVITLVPTEQRPCGAELKARVGAPTIVCRDCGAEYDAAEQAAWIDKESAEALATGPMIAHALAESGYRVKPATIRNWAERTRQWMARAARRKDGDPPLQYEEHPIQQVACSVVDRLPLYRVGDVYRRVKADPERRRGTDRIGA